MGYSVYILANESNNVLYVGVTDDVARRIAEHKAHLDKRSFTARYNVTKLVYVEHCGDVNDAIAREKQLKRWRRAKKIALIASINPNFDELYW